jgi:hypothetical protein
MTPRLKQAFDEASQLPPEEQDAFAEMLLADLASEAKWTELLRGSQERLRQLADEALKEFKRR